MNFLSWKDFIISPRLRFKISADSQSSWGVHFDFKDDWTVRRVLNGGQFHKLQIKEGWRLVKVGRYRLTGKHAVTGKRREKLRLALLEKPSCHLVFATVI